MRVVGDLRAVPKQQHEPRVPFRQAHRLQDGSRGIGLLLGRQAAHDMRHGLGLQALRAQPQGVLHQLPAIERARRLDKGERTTPPPAGTGPRRGSRGRRSGIPARSPRRHGWTWSIDGVSSAGRCARSRSVPCGLVRQRQAEEAGKPDRLDLRLCASKARRNTSERTSMQNAPERRAGIHPLGRGKRAAGAVDRRVPRHPAGSHRRPGRRSG